MTRTDGADQQPRHDADGYRERIAFLERRLARCITQQERLERIDDINRRLIRHVNRELEEALHRAEQGNQAKTDFLAMISHEIRSPLNIVLGMAEALADTDLQANQRGYLTPLLTAGRQLFEQFTNILEFSRLESGSISVVREPFDCDQLLSELQSTMDTLAGKRNLDFVFRGPLSMLGQRLGDAPKIKQILLNILNNALKFTDHGYIDMSVNRDRRHPVPGMIHFRISDTGIGIPPDYIGTIFNRFSQVENGLSVNRGGVGLGLAICLKLLDALDGEIRVSSTLGKGTTFDVRIPLPAAPALEAAATGERQSGARFPVTSPSPVRILVTEDVAANGEVIKRYLNAYDVAIDDARNGEEAIRLFRERRYDIVLMDVRMPGIDGVVAMRQIREMIHAGMAEKTPVIAVTAYAFPEQVTSYLQKGFDGILTKPFTKADLIKTISYFLNVSPSLNQEPDRLTARESSGPVDEVPDVLAPLFDGVIATLRHDIEKMDAHLCSGSPACFKECCHAAKGLAALYGLHRFADRLANLEALADRDIASNSVPSLEPVYTHLETIAQSWKETTGTEGKKRPR